MVQGGQRLSEVDRDCPRWSKNVPDGQLLSEIVRYCQRLSEVVRDGQNVYSKSFLVC